MARFYTYYTDQGRVATVHATQAAALASASGDSTRTAQQGAANDVAVEPGWFRATNGNVSATQVVSDAAQRTAIKELAAEHGNICLDMMKPGWVLNDGGVGFVAAPTADGSASRWRNTYYWIVSPVACIAAACDNTTGWTVEQCEGLLLAYRTLIPAIEENIATWYRAHRDNTWRGYFVVSSGQVRAYFHAVKGVGTTIEGLGGYQTPNAFTSDALASTIWAGAANVEDVQFAEHATPNSLIA